MTNIITFPRLGLSFTLNRAAIAIGNFSVYWYGLIITFGMLLAILYGLRESKFCGISSDDFFNMLIIAIPVSIICARAYYVIFSWDMYKDNIADVFDIRGGGLAIYGGVIGAAATVIIYSRAKKNKPRLGHGYACRRTSYRTVDRQMGKLRKRRGFRRGNLSSVGNDCLHRRQTYRRKCSSDLFLRILVELYRYMGSSVIQTPQKGKRRAFLCISYLVRRGQNLY